MSKRNRESVFNFLRDPTSQQFSMSRLCLGVVILIYIPIYFWLCYIKVNVPVAVIVAVVASLCSVYGINSAMGAWGRYRCTESYSYGENNIGSTLGGIAKDMFGGRPPGPGRVPPQPPEELAGKR